MQHTKSSSCSKQRSHQHLLENMLKNICLSLLESNPKPKNISKSLYFTCLAIKALELNGNKFPSEAEINEMELLIKCFSRRKEWRNIFNNAFFINATKFNLAVKAA